MLLARERCRLGAVKDLLNLAARLHGGFVRIVAASA